MLIKGLFLISRPLNSFLSGFAVLIGAIAAITHPLTEHQVFGIVLGYFATSIVAISGYAINDVYDIEIDKINMPHRPIPAGYITINQARAYAAILFLISNLMALLISIPAFLLAFSGGFLLYLYAIFFKRSGFIGNVMIGVLTAIPFVFGGVLTESYNTLIYPALFAFLLIVSREVIKDIEDVHGDKIENVQSVALRYGVKSARNLGIVILAILIIIIPIPILLGYYKTAIFIIMVILVISAVFYVSYLLFNKSETEIIANATRCKKILKSCMSIGVIGFIFEGLTKIM